MTDVVVPAHNEAAGLDPVLAAIRGAPSVRQLIVVVDKSSDETAGIAGRFADLVVPISAGDKGTAMAVGVAHVGTDTVLFIDADLVGLLPAHVEGLATLPPLDGQLVGIRGSDPIARLGGLLPSISGERRIPTWLAASLPLAGSAWRAETIINVAVARAGLPHSHLLLAGVFNPPKPLEQTPERVRSWAQVAGEELAHAPELIRYISGTRRSLA